MTTDANSPRSFGNLLGLAFSALFSSKPELFQFLSFSFLLSNSSRGLVHSPFDGTGCRIHHDKTLVLFSNDGSGSNTSFLLCVFCIVSRGIFAHF